MKHPREDLSTLLKVKIKKEGNYNVDVENRKEILPLFCATAQSLCPYMQME